MLVRDLKMKKRHYAIRFGELGNTKVEERDIFCPIVWKHVIVFSCLLLSIRVARQNFSPYLNIYLLLCTASSTMYILSSDLCSDNILSLLYYAGVLRIGQITFDMSLSINYSNLEPQIPELTEFIAHELDVNTTQVRLILYFYLESFGGAGYIFCKLHKIDALNYCLMKFLEVDVYLTFGGQWLLVNCFRSIF